VLYTEDLEADDGNLDEADTDGTSGPHGTNVAGIIASECQACCAFELLM
jgi:hypothetical protein